MKTRRSLMLPGPRFYIDMEKGADEYGDLFGEDDRYMTASAATEVFRALDYLDDLAPEKVGTVIIDPIGVVWTSLQAGVAERRAGKKGMEAEEVIFDVGTWSRLNRTHGDMMTRLINSPWNVVMIARGKELKKDDVVVGYGYEGNKSLDFYAKTVVVARSDGDIVIKDRMSVWKTGRVTAQKRLDFRDLVRAGAGSGGMKLTSPSDAAVQDSRDPVKDGHHPSWDTERGRFCVSIGQLGYKYESLAEWLMARAEDRGEAPETARPSRMASDTRQKLLGWLGAEGTKPSYDAFVEVFAKREVSQ
jgi:hypothetical protein